MLQEIFKIKMSLSRANQRGFTLIEILVSMFVFCIILASSVLAGNFNIGRIRANQDRAVTESAKAVFDAINQKMMNANGTANFGSTKVYGFNILTISGNDVLVIASGTGASTICTFFASHDNAIWMLQNSCSTPALPDINQVLTNSKVVVDSFVISPTSIMTVVNPSSIPEIKIDMSIHHKDDVNSKTNFQTSYILSYENIKMLSN